jgi:hypothetical protein
MEEKKIVQEDKKNKKKSILLTILKKHKIGLAIVLFFICASSTFAWFIYNKTVDMGLHAHVKTWDVMLGNGQDDTYEFRISDLYPGMDNAYDTVNVINNGEMSADLSIEFKSITLFGELQEEGTDYNVVVSNNGRTFNITGYPFTLTFSLGAAVIGEGQSSSLSFSLTWDYERDGAECYVDSGGQPTTENQCDIEDTRFGERSYEFSQSNPDDYSLEIELAMSFTETTPGP